MARLKQSLVFRRRNSSFSRGAMSKMAAAMGLVSLLIVGCEVSPFSLGSMDGYSLNDRARYLKMESLGGEFDAGRQALQERHPFANSQEIIPELTFELPRIYFDYDSDHLSARERMKLVQMAGLLRKQAEAQILIEGHCDERGSTEYNFALGQRRAERVRSHLVALGIDKKRLHTISYGEEWPLDPSSLPEAYRLNRRVQFLAYWP